MATSENLLSATKNKESMDEIDGNPEDDKVVEVGGPDLDTGAYADFKFDAVAGVKVDTTFPDPVVKAEKADKGPEEEVTTPIANLPESYDGEDEIDEETDGDFLKELDGEDELVEADDEPEDEETEDDDIEVDLADLVDDDTELVDLGPGDGEDVVGDDEDMDSESEDDMEEAVDYEEGEDEMSEAESWDETPIEEADTEEDFPVFEMADEDELEEADDVHPQGCRCDDCKMQSEAKYGTDEESSEAEGEDEEEPEPVAEGKSYLKEELSLSEFFNFLAYFTGSVATLGVIAVAFLASLPVFRTLLGGFLAAPEFVKHVVQSYREYQTTKNLTSAQIKSLQAEAQSIYNAARPQVKNKITQLSKRLMASINTPGAVGQDYLELQRIVKSVAQSDGGVQAESKFRVSFKFDDSKTLFENNTTLTEDEKRQSRALFEAAVREAAQSIGTQLQEAYAKRFVKHKKLHEQKTAKLIDQYLSYVVEQWVKDNAVPLRGHIHAKLTENFMVGLKSLFEQNYIDVPTSKVNVVESLAKKVKKLSGDLDTAQKETVRLHTEMKNSVSRERKALIKEHKARLIAEAATVLPSSERGKFAKRAELMPFGASSKEFKKNLVALREQYVRAKRSVERPINVPDAAPLFESKTPAPKAPTAVDTYVAAAGKLTR